MEITKAQVLDLYRTMQKIRQFETRLRALSVGNEIPGFVHVSIGEEACCAGVCAALRPNDRVTSTHRGHGHLIAKGGRLDRMYAELFGRRTGYCKGKGGSMHICDFSLGMLGANGIVGGGIPIATGSALAAAVSGRDDVTACFFGDGASNEGTFHESLNLAAVWKLPILFVCENNGYGEFTPAKDVTAVTDIAKRAAGYDMRSEIVDGNNVLEVFEATSNAAAHARRGEGPTLLELKTYRWDGHFVGEEAVVEKTPYRSKEEIESWKKRCPLLQLETSMVKAGRVSAAEFEQIVKEVAAEVEAAVEFARQSPLPEPSDALDDVYA